MHRGIMVYGASDGPTLMMLMNRYGEDNKPSELLLAHRYPNDTSGGLMIKEIMDAIQHLECSIGKDFLDAFIVMPEDDATPPWHVDYGPASYILTYKKGHDYLLYAVHRKGLFDWWVPGGRWIDYLKPKSPDLLDAHYGAFVPMSLATLAAGIPGNPHESGQRAALAIENVDWEEMEKHLHRFELDASCSRKALLEKGIDIPTFREYFHQLYPGIRDQVAPDLIEAHIHARQFSTYMTYRKMVEDLRTEHKIPPARMWSMEEYRWSDTLLDRLSPLRAKTLSCWIVGGVVYDLDDLMTTEEHLHKGLDALEALPPETIVAVVDVHY
ncbi:hypothetical protein D3C85_159220 [compost metagenome]